MYILFFLVYDKKQANKNTNPRGLICKVELKSSPKNRPNLLRAENFAGKLLWRKALISVRGTQS